MAPKGRDMLLIMAVAVVTVITAVTMGPGTASAKPSSRTPAVELKVLKQQVHKSRSTLNFWNGRGKWALHVRHDKCWQIHGKQRRRVCHEARQALKLHKDRLAKLEARLERLTGPSWCRGLTGNRALGCAMAYEIWPSAAEWRALEELWDDESSWNQYARNPSGACGIPQGLNNCSYGYNPVEQIRWGLRYILTNPRYGTPMVARAFFLAKNWY